MTLTKPVEEVERKDAVKFNEFITGRSKGMDFDMDTTIGRRLQ